MKKRKDGRYMARVYLGLDENNRKKFKTVYGKTKSEVKQKESEIRLKFNKGIDVTAEHDTFGDWVNRWLTVKKDLLTDSQYNTYRSYLKHFCILEKYELCQLTVADFQEIINELSKYNPNTGKPTAKKSLREFRAVANQVFEFAVENRVVEFNPVKYVKIPQNAPQKTRRALTKEEQGWIINTPHRAQLPAMIMMLSGLRLGECLALQWKDIDLFNATINVHQTLKMQGNKSEIKQGAKTVASVRVVDIPQTLVDFLKTQKFDSPFDYVVTTAHKEIMTKTAWNRLWSSYIKELNFKYGKFLNRPKSKFDPKGVPMMIEPFTAHYLRHTHATNLFYAGYDLLYVQNQMGHTRPETTMNIYTHLVKQKRKGNASKLDAYLEEIG